jgi:hypothetical protein
MTPPALAAAGQPPPFPAIAGAATTDSDVEATAVNAADDSIMTGIAAPAALNSTLKRKRKGNEEWSGIAAPAALNSTLKRKRKGNEARKRAAGVTSSPERAKAARRAAGGEQREEHCDGDKRVRKGNSKYDDYL